MNQPCVYIVKSGYVISLKVVIIWLVPMTSKYHIIPVEL